jgi:hypothetical protein
MSSLSWRRWGASGLLAIGLIVAYVTAWRPARAVLMQHVAHPVLTSIDTERSRQFRYAFQRGALRIGVQSPQPGVASTKYSAPAGRDFLLPALLLVLLFPYRPYWLYFWGFHLAVGVLFLLFTALGIAWADAAFALKQFLKQYVVQALSLSAPLLALAYERGLFGPHSGRESVSSDS